MIWQQLWSWRGLAELSSHTLVQHPHKQTDRHKQIETPQDQSETDTMATAPQHSPYTCNCYWTNGPGIFPHYIVLGKVITGRQILSGPLARSTRRAGELICQVFMRLTGCADPAAVLAWETGIWAAECDSLKFFKRPVMVCFNNIKRNIASHLPAFSSSHCVRRGRCTARWAPLLWASESDRGSGLDSLPILLLAHNRNDQQSAGSWRYCIGPCRPPGNQTSPRSQCLKEQRVLER